MTQKLRDEMERIAATVTPVEIPMDTWARGRRAHRRDVVRRAATTVAVVLAVLGSVLAMLSQPGTREITPADTVAELPVVLPARIAPLPDHLISLTDGGFRWTHGVGETNLAIGPAVAAYVEGDSYLGGLVVVITRDGRAHPLVLPGFVGETTGAASATAAATSLALLSPDGTRLAWVAGAPAAGREDFSAVPTSVNITDLTNGVTVVTDLRPTLTGGQAMLPHRLAWSPDSRWLAWEGREHQQYNASGSGSRGPSTVGVIRAGESRTRVVPANGELMAVSDSGQVIAWDAAGGVLRPGGGADFRIGKQRRTAITLSRPIEETDAGGLLSPDERLLAVGKFVMTDNLPVWRLPSGRFTPRRFSSDVYGGPVSSTPLGWVGNDHLLAAITTSDDPTYGTGTRLALMTARGTPAAESSFRLLSEVEVAPESLSLATVGLDVSHPMRDFPEQDWPWSTERKVWTGVGVAAGLGALGLLGWLLWRRTRVRGIWRRSTSR